MKTAYILCATLFITAAASSVPIERPNVSEGVYRIPYEDGTEVSVFDDARTHRPLQRIDLVGEPRDAAAHRIVAAADGIVMAIQDGYKERQSGRAASECRNNYLWLSHPNGEWTLYSHMRASSSTHQAKLRVGDAVRAGQYIGDEGDVGCAMLSHLHFEVALPASHDPIDVGGFLSDNADNKRNSIPIFCVPMPQELKKDATYFAAVCPSR